MRLVDVSRLFTDQIWRTLVASILLLTFVYAEAYVVKDNRIIAEDMDSFELTCWTCPNKTDNEACNNWAPDIHCPQNYTVCKTVHRLHVGEMRSIYVSKVCAQRHECTRDSIGCFDTETREVQDCVSCCDTPYCNEQVPTNHTTAIELSVLTWTTSSGSRSFPAFGILLTSLVLTTSVGPDMFNMQNALFSIWLLVIQVLSKISSLFHRDYRTTSLFTVAGYHLELPIQR